MLNDYMPEITDNMKCDKKKTMTVREFCEVYGIGINKGYEIIHSKGFPKVTIGRKVLIIRNKVDEWFTNNIGAKF